MVPRLVLRMMAAFAALAWIACSEHVPDGPGPGDRTPPGIVDVMAWDVNHVVLVFDEPVTRWSAENREHYFLESPSLPDSVHAVSMDLEVAAAALHDDFRTVTLTTTSLQREHRYVITVTGISDAEGNAIPGYRQRGFYGTDTDDTTPPQVVYRTPAPNAAGIATSVFITVGFSEAVDPETIFRGLRVQGEGARLDFIRYDDLLHFICRVDSLQLETRYTVSLTRVRDTVGNTMPDVQWTFDTQSSYDTTPPVVASSWPANGALNVDVATDLWLTFSEPMDPYSVRVRLPVKPGATQWSHGGRRVTYEAEWEPGRQYTIQVRPAEMRDQAGNAGTQLFTLTFSTGAALETGSFAGTITGDPQSLRASDPTGGLVFAGVTSPNDIFTSVVGIVGTDDTYEIPNLPNGTYYPFFILDSDGNGIYQPRWGDAIGVYGVSDWFAGDEPATVRVDDIRVEAIDFPLYDPSAVYGLLSYDGERLGENRVGLFRAEGFDPLTSVPIVAVTAAWDGSWDFVVNTLDTGPIADGSYYVMAFRDTNGNSAFDPSLDPVGIYGGATPVAIGLSHGKDVSNVSITLLDPIPAAATGSIPWPDAPRSSLLQQVEAMLKAEQ